MNVKGKTRWLLVMGGMLCGIAVRADHTVTVAGLVHLDNYQAALLVITDSPPEALFLMTTHKWVKEGQELDDLYVTARPAHIEIRSIDFTNSIVRARENNAASFYTPSITNPPDLFSGNGLWLCRAAFDDALELYGDLKNRTLLVHPDVKHPSMTISVPATNRTDGLGLLEKIVKKQGVTITADGDKFEWIIPAGATNILSPATMPVRPAPPGSVAAPLPVGAIDFNGAGLPRLMTVYQTLVAQKWVQDKPLPAGTYNFQNQTPLTKAEILHAFDVLLAWHGLRIEPVNDTSFKLVPFVAGE